MRSKYSEYNILPNYYNLTATSKSRYIEVDLNSSATNILGYWNAALR